MSNQFDLFKRKNNNLYNFRCPECGDSSRNRFKARGYMYQRDNQWFFKCHNCGYSVSFGTFLKKHAPILYKEYSLELLSDKETKGALEEFIEPEPVPKVRGLWPLKKLKKISQLPHTHKAKLYIQQRKIPNIFHSQLFYSPNFAEWVNEMLPGKLNPDIAEKRIIIPLIKNNNLIGFQGRSLSSNSIRYITIMLNEAEQKIYGLDRYKSNTRGYVFEGPFDSMFLPNSIAVCGSDIVSTLEYSDLNKDNITIVFDNERRNTQINKKIAQAIDRGYNICLWPDTVHSKDVNDMIINGMNVADIKMIIDSNTHSGLAAKLALSAFKRG